MKILILGGTKFLGRHLVEAALTSGHQVTLFNRGKTNPDLFPNIEKLHGDRDNNLDALKGRRWDAAIDTCAYVPTQIQAMTKVLADSISHYTFISSISVYLDFSEASLNEDAPLAVIPPDAANGGNSGEYYGANKALCERAAERAMPGRVLIVRPGIIIGPHDPTNRFSRWVRRAALGGEVLCPAPADTPLQIIDARDLATWIIRMVEARQTGYFNATGPATVLTFQQMLEQCKTGSGGHARFVWVEEKFLLEHEINPSRDLPLWIPKSAKEYTGFFAVDCQRALKSGLTLRPLAETARDVLAASNGLQEPGGLASEKEAKLLQAWKAGICV